MGLACNGRVDEELTNALGLYTRFVPSVVALTDNLPFEQALTIVKNSFSNALDEQLYFTWEATHTSPSLYFPVCFDYTVWPAHFYAGDVTFSFYQRYSCTEPFELKLSTLQVGEHLCLELYYDPAHFAGEHTRYLLLLSRTLLQNAVTHPQTAIGEFAESSLLISENIEKDISRLPRSLFLIKCSISFLKKAWVVQTPKINLAVKVIQNV